MRPHSAILDLARGHGVPISQTLIEEGFTVFSVDASRTLIEAFRKRFHNAFVECAGVEDSEFFQRTFDGVVACGLMFLMPEDTQSLVIHKVARALNPNGRFLFTFPKKRHSLKTLTSLDLLLHSRRLGPIGCLDGNLGSASHRAGVRAGIKW